MNEISAAARRYLSEIGRKGGQQTSPRKRRAIKRNVKLALAKRWPGRPPPSKKKRKKRRKSGSAVKAT